MPDMRRFFTPLLLAIILLSACTAAPAQPAEKPVEPSAVIIGVAIGLSGDISIYGESQRNGIDLAMKEVNSSKYLPGKFMLKVVYEDAGASPDQARLAVEKLIKDGKIAGLIGPTLSSQALAANPIAQKAGIPVIAVSNTVPGITEMGDYIFRCSMPESSVITNTMKSSSIQGDKNVVIFWGRDDDFTINGYKAFLEASKKYNMTILGEEQFNRGETDFKERLSRLMKLEPDAFLVSALIKEAIPIVIQLRSAGYTETIIGNNGFNTPELVRQAGEAANGVMVGTAWNMTGTGMKNTDFILNYEKSFGKKPDQFAAQAYTAVWLYAEAIRSAGSAQPKAVRDALARISNLNTPLGLFSFSQDREPIHPSVVQLIKDGKFTILHR